MHKWGYMHSKGSAFSIVDDPGMYLLGRCASQRSLLETI